MGQIHRWGVGSFLKIELFHLCLTYQLRSINPKKSNSNKDHSFVDSQILRIPFKLKKHKNFGACLLYEPWFT